MDERDFRIMTGIMDQPTASYETLGRAVGLSGTAVKSRLERMRDQGPLHGFVGLPHPAVFGWTSTVYWLGDDEKLSVGRALAQDHVVRAGRLHTDEVVVMTYHDPRNDPGPELAGSLGVEATASGSQSEWRGAPPILSRLQWRVLGCLIRAPRAAVKGIQEATGLSRNTVSRIRRRLFDEGAVRAFPLLHQAEASGLVLYSVVVHVHHQETLAKVQRRLPRAVPVMRGEGTTGHPGATLMGQADALADVVAAVNEVHRMDGVASARLIIDMEREVAVARLQHWVQERVDAWPQAPRRAPQ